MLLPSLLAVMSSKYLRSFFSFNPGHSFPPQSVVRLSTQVGFSCRVFPLWRSLFEMNMHWFAIFLQIPNFVFLYLDFSTNNFILILVFLMAEKDLIVPNFYLYPLPAVGKLCEEPMGDISGFPGQMVQLTSCSYAALSSCIVKNPCVFVIIKLFVKQVAGKS